MTTFYLLVFYHLVLNGNGINVSKAPTVLVAKTSTEACRIRGFKKDGNHADVEALKMDVLDDGSQAPSIRPAVLVCEGD